MKLVQIEIRSKIRSQDLHAKTTQIFSIQIEAIYTTHAVFLLAASGLRFGLRTHTQKNTAKIDQKENTK